jgi:hypothetical protein
MLQDKKGLRNPTRQPQSQSKFQLAKIYLEMTAVYAKKLL